MCTHVVLGDVRVVVLDAVVKNGDDDALASVSTSPCWRYVHVIAPDGALLQVPLLFVKRVREQAAGEKAEG